ncbi:hypothetical protein [Paraburkholderia sp. Ac-20347]|uniref:hypothetical protein n=1 Tax=Paraburkholderia sp. Ac-20347 TaxID=2703892 RepID=UPI0019812410|nr:hypothetical protein [Paraburkholderia sp. Ac-20347]MBN3808122.1 hypothetical protein [Paraburkholderia sp. Ac-20347]
MHREKNLRTRSLQRRRIALALQASGEESPGECVRSLRLDVTIEAGAIGKYERILSRAQDNAVLDEKG